MFASEMGKKKISKPLRENTFLLCSVLSACVYGEDGFHNLMKAVL
jgi:hypothetical protein